MSMDNMQRDQRIAHHVGHGIGCTQVGAGEQTIGHAALFLRPKPPGTTVTNLRDKVGETSIRTRYRQQQTRGGEVVAVLLHYRRETSKK